MKALDGKIVFRIKSAESVDIECELHHEEGASVTEHEKEHLKLVEQIKEVMIRDGMFNRREGDNFLREKVSEREQVDDEYALEKNKELEHE